MMTNITVRTLLYVPGHAEVTVTEPHSDEALIDASLFGYEPKVTDLAAVACAIADQYPDAFISHIQSRDGGGWDIDLVSTDHESAEYESAKYVDSPVPPSYGPYSEMYPEGLYGLPGSGR